MTVSHQHFTARLLQRAGQATELGTFATVGAAYGTGMADVALTAVGDAERTVDKELQLHVGRGAYLVDLRKGQLARQHHLGETHILQKFHLLRGAVVGLGTGVQRDGGKSSASNPMSCTISASTPLRRSGESAAGPAPVHDRAAGC